MLCTESRSPTPPLILDPFPCPSDSRRPSYFGVGRSTHLGVVVIHFPISTFFCFSPNFASAPNYTFSIEAVLQDCKNTCTRLWILSFRYAPKSGSFAKDLSYCRSKRSL